MYLLFPSNLATMVSFPCTLDGVVYCWKTQISTCLSCHFVLPATKWDMEAHVMVHAGAMPVQWANGP